MLKEQDFIERGFERQPLSSLDGDKRGIYSRGPLKFICTFSQKDGSLAWVSPTNVLNCVVSLDHFQIKCDYKDLTWVELMGSMSAFVASVAKKSREEYSKTMNELQMAHGLDEKKIRLINKEIEEVW